MDPDHPRNTQEQEAVGEDRTMPTPIHEHIVTNEGQPAKTAPVTSKQKDEQNDEDTLDAKSASTKGIRFVLCLFVSTMHL